MKTRPTGKAAIEAEITMSYYYRDYFVGYETCHLCIKKFVWQSGTFKIGCQPEFTDINQEQKSLIQKACVLQESSETFHLKYESRNCQVFLSF